MPEAATWKYLENQFEVRTRDSRALMDKQVQFHSSALKQAAAAPGADPRIIALNTAFTAVKTTWDTEYSEWKNSDANRQGSTVSFETLLYILANKPGPEQASKIEEWDSTIRTVTPKGSGLYETLLPQGRAPFSGHSYQSILDAVQGLGTRLSQQTTKPALVTLGTTVSAFAVQMEAARTAQQGMESEASEESSDVIPVRLATARALYGDLGMLMHIYQDNPAAVAAFFDLDSLRVPEKKKAPPTP